MPPNIHVVSMKPEFNRENQLVLHVVVATERARQGGRTGEAHGEVAALPHAADRSGERHWPTAASRAAAGGNIQFDIAAVYVPFADGQPTESGSDRAGQEAEAPAKTGGDKPLRREPPARTYAAQTACPGRGRGH